MSEKPKQTSFFIQDPFTEEVQGPLSVQELKQWFAQGSVCDWGVSKSPNGPWTPASAVKGLAIAKAPDTALPKNEPAPQPTTPPAPSTPPPTPVAETSSAPIRGKRIVAFDLAKQYFPKSLIGRVLVSIVGLWLVCGILFGIGELWSESYGTGAAYRRAKAAADAQMAKTEEALRQSAKEADKAAEQFYGKKAWQEKVIRDGEYERAKRELGR